MKLFLCALALAFAMEGVAFALFPGIMRQAMREALERPDNALRQIGATALVAAAILACLAKILAPV